MFSREEKKQLVQKFWADFDLYCQTLPDLRHRKKKWILHDTKISHLDLKFDCDRSYAQVAIEINFRSEDKRLAVFDLLQKYKPILELGIESEMIWELCYTTNLGKEVSRIYLQLDGVDLHREEHWPRIHAFFAENMELLQTNFLDMQDVLIEEVKECLYNL